MTSAMPPVTPPTLPPAADEADAEEVKQRTSRGGDLAIAFGLGVLRVLSWLPYPIFRRLGEGLGGLAWRLAGKRRRVTQINLSRCMPALDEAAREALGLQSFRYQVRSFFDRSIVWFGSEARIRRLVRLEGMEHFEAHRGRPVILLAPHFCGIDAGGMRFQIESVAASMYANQKSQLLSRVMTEGRSRFNGARMFLRNDGLRPAVRALRDGVPFYFLPDMDLGPRDAVFVPFFGVPAATVTSVARLARMTGAVVVPIVTTMDDAGYVARLYPAWPDYPDKDVVVATRRMNAFIEDRVREAPAQYLWSHKRFKTRPEGEPGFY